MNEAQKSRAELKDVVGVFLSKIPPEENNSLSSQNKNLIALDSRVISFVSPFRDEETLALNLTLPLQLTRFFDVCYRVTHTPGPDEVNLIQKLYGLPTEMGSQVNRSLIVMDLRHSNAVGLESLLRILDSLVLVIRPNVEDLKNAYKVIKACHYVNPQLETPILFNASMTSAQVESVFARFSEMVSRFLARSVRCLGASSLELGPTSAKMPLSDSLHLDALVLAGRKTPTLERIRFLNKLKVLAEADS